MLLASGLSTTVRAMNVCSQVPLPGSALTAIAPASGSVCSVSGTAAADRATVCVAACSSAACSSAAAEGAELAVL
ncbi:hypothetical protein GCM10020219_060660 [Nonomuraea dietziae]